MTVTGMVRIWSDEEGWGVVDSDETPGGCWAHFSAVRQQGYRTLTPGDRVHLDWEAGEQDGYAFRATAVWPEGSERSEPGNSAPGAAYSSALTVTFDDPDRGETVVQHADGNDPEAIDRLQALMRDRRAAGQQFGWTSLQALPPDQ